MDPEPEHAADVIDDDMSRPSYKTEQLLSEASDVSLPSRKRHWMDTRLRRKARKRFTNPLSTVPLFLLSFSGNDDEMSDAILPIPSIPHDADHVETELPIPASDILLSPTNYVTQL